jgi:hypothetical protein
MSNVQGYIPNYLAFRTGAVTLETQQKTKGTRRKDLPCRKGICSEWAAGQVEHTGNVRRRIHLQSPGTERLIEQTRVREHLIHFCHLGNFPRRQILVKNRGTIKLTVRKR